MSDPTQLPGQAKFDAFKSHAESSAWALSTLTTLREQLDYLLGHVAALHIEAQAKPSITLYADSPLFEAFQKIIGKH